MKPSTGVGGELTAKRRERSSDTLLSLSGFRPPSAPLCLPLLRRERAQRQRVDGRPHRLTEQAVHGALAGDATLTPERGRYDEDAIVPAAAGGAGVADMAGALVLDHELYRIEPAPQGVLQPLYAVLSAR